MQKIILTDPNHLSQIRLGLEDRIMNLANNSHWGIERQIQECYDAYLYCGGVLPLDQLRRLAKPAPKTFWGWLKGVLKGA